MQRIFVETTIQIQRLLQDPIAVPRIETVLQRHQVITSTYVWMEVQRTVGQDYQYLIDLLLTRQPTTISQLMRHLGTGENLYSSRSLKRMLHITAYWLELLDSATFEPIELAYQLRRQRRHLLHQAFFEHVDEVVNPTHCDLIQPDYTIQTSGRMSCRRETAACSLHELLQANQSVLQPLQTNSAVFDNLDVKTQRALRDIIPDFTMAKGERNCWSIGDLIITLECPGDAALWTTNIQHFDPLCQALGKSLFRPD